ncbi:MAG: DUF1127 domain-containing protein [Rhodobacteraceae bacterium]|nr:DUF1127 domain-containing protein [Paracoccaceae bacterium]
MANVAFAAVPVTSTSLRSGFKAFNPLNRLIRWHTARKTRDALLSLTDSQLSDIGLNRGDVDKLAFGDTR